MKLLIAKGDLPPDAIEKYFEDEEKAVFGQDVKHDKYGNPIEVGIGSASQPSRNSVEAYKNHQMGNKHGPEKGYAENLERMEAHLAEFEAEQKIKRDAARKKKKAT